MNGPDEAARQIQNLAAPQKSRIFHEKAMKAQLSRGRMRGVLGGVFMWDFKSNRGKASQKLKLRVFFRSIFFPNFYCNFQVSFTLKKTCKKEKLL